MSYFKESPHCDNCGCRHYVREHGDRILEEKFALGQRFREVRAQHAKEIAEWEIKEIQNISERKWLQRKVKSQSTVIKQLEGKLRQQGRPPYRDEPENEVTDLGPRVDQQQAVVNFVEEAW